MFNLPVVGVMCFFFFFNDLYSCCSECAPLPISFTKTKLSLSLKVKISHCLSHSLSLLLKRRKKFFFFLFYFHLPSYLTLQFQFWQVKKTVNIISPPKTSLVYTERTKITHYKRELHRFISFFVFSFFNSIPGTTKEKKISWVNFFFFLFFSNPSKSSKFLLLFWPFLSQYLFICILLRIIIPPLSKFTSPNLRTLFFYTNQKGLTITLA